MPAGFIALLRAHEAALTQTWADAVYAERRTDLPALLSYRQLIEPVAEILDEWARVLEAGAGDGEIAEAARWLRQHAQVRFQQGCLLDEVARELMILRVVLTDFLWREGHAATGGDLRELRAALRRTDVLLDELITQALVIYAASLRPPVRTRTTPWPPPRRRKGLSERDGKL
jgi:hypothetical protein